jgi:uncharacterized protein (TIGR03663 family)
LIPRTFAPLVIGVYAVISGIAAKYFLAWIDWLAVYSTSPKTEPIANAFVQNLKDRTIIALPILILLLAFLVVRRLVQAGSQPLLPTERRGIALKIDPRTQRLLDTILTTRWTAWLWALIVGWLVFLVLFSSLFTNLSNGIADGIWQGLYYWVQQVYVARGGQPWYYYLLLIPLYEQVGVIFGIIGLIRCLVQPSRFRLFLIFWCFGNFFLYSWAAEKMPWLMIHITMPMMLIASIGLEPCVLLVWHSLQAAWNWLTSPGWRTANEELVSAWARIRGVLAGSIGWLGTIAALVLLIPTMWNMHEVSYINPSNSYAEMMVYVQSTTYVNTVMDKITAVDQKLDGGTKQIRIGLMNGAEWPFSWYLRDYPNVCYGYPSSCPSWTGKVPVILGGDDDALYTLEDTLNATYHFQRWVMRGQFDQGYMPAPCIATKGQICPTQSYTGYGPLLWLSYGDNPPDKASFNFKLAFQHIWNWWWYRTPFGTTDGGSGGYEMELFLANSTGVTP